MKRLIGVALAIVALTACSEKKNFNDENVSFAEQQMQLQVDRIEAAGEIAPGRWLNPRTVDDSTRNIQYIPIDDWCSGFFPGSVWLVYDLSKNDKWLPLAKKYTEQLDSIKHLKWHHDVGFMLETSYGQGYKITGNPAYREVLIEGAKSLSTRFRPSAGIIQSWDIRGWQAHRGWECPVIIDNMMNLELLFNATTYTGDSTYWKIATSHADVTMANQFRDDNSCYHVIDYSLKDGSVRNKNTAQGLAHESSWARGQAWAIYGYTVCYRYTGDSRYLEQAVKAADYYWNHANLPEDKVAYWDFNAPEYPGNKDKNFDNWRIKTLDDNYDITKLRDASAAAITASALYELSEYTDETYKNKADKIMTSLGSPEYRAQLGENQFFILMHSVGSIPHGHEIDVPLNYADYYFLEALKRKMEIEKNK